MKSFEVYRSKTKFFLNIWNVFKEVLVESDRFESCGTRKSIENGTATYEKNMKQR